MSWRARPAGRPATTPFMTSWLIIATTAGARATAENWRRPAEPGRVLAEQRAERRLRRRGRQRHAGRDRHIAAPDTSLPGLPRYRRGVAASCRTAAAP